MSAFTAKTVLKSSLAGARRCMESIRQGSTYKAAVLEAVGKPLEIKELKRPKLKKNQVRIQVAYCSVNTVDLQTFRDGSIKVPFTPGYELSGEVLEVGKDACSFANKGDRVVVLSLANFGGLAEECVVNMEDVWCAPTNLALKDSAVLAFGHSTALYTFGKLCSPKEGDNIIVSAGPAGLGLAAVDVAANIYKAKVVAVTNTEVQSELTREKGAFHTVHFHSDLRKEITGLLENKGAEVVYDAVGGYMLEELASCVADGGKVFNACPTIGKTISTPPPNSSLTIVRLSKLKEQNVENYRQIISDTLDMANEGMITAHISEKFDFKDVNRAIDYIDSRTCTGKVVVKLD